MGLGGADQPDGGAGLAPRCTPGAVRLARQSSTAYAATAARPGPTRWPAAPAPIPRACRPPGARRGRTCRRRGAPAAPRAPRRGSRWAWPWRTGRAGSRPAGRCRAARAGSGSRSRGEAGGAARTRPSTLTWCSSIVSRSADCVRGGVRFSSSTSTTWAKTGPGRKSQVPLSGRNTDTPVMSDGSRSGWPWTRDSSAPSEAARVRARTVLPTPGTSSMRRWPPERAAIAAASSAPSLPSTTCSRLRTSARPRAMASSRSRTRSSTTLMVSP